MPRNYKSKNIWCTYDKKNLIYAAEAVKKGSSIRNAAKNFNVPVSTLGKHYKEINLCPDINLSLGGGRKTELNKSDEDTLAQFLKVCAAHGEGLTRNETLELVHQFVISNNIPTRWGKEKQPSIDWFLGFLERHRDLCVRKGEALSSQRVRGADPFIVEKFYKALEKLFQDEGITKNDGHRIYNCDETSFSHDPKDVMVVSEKGKKRVSRNVAGSGKTNTTVLACGAANGDKMPPYVIFSGKFIWSSWIPQDDYPGTAYSAQKKGWMEGSLFANWFSEIFVKNIPSLEKRQGKKVVLIFDGVSFHISYNLVKSALENGVILVKLPPNLSHHMQPLDKTVFKTMKTDWNKLMIKWNRENPGVPLPKCEFSRNIRILWENSFKQKNLISGFASTGIFPLDPTRFPEEAYDPIKLAKFKVNQISTLQNNEISSDVQAMKDITLQENVPCTSTESGSPSHFEHFIRVKLAENLRQKSHTDIPKKRKRISSNMGEILTSPEVLEKLSALKENKENKPKNKQKRKASNTEDSQNLLQKPSTNVEILLEKYYAVYYDANWYIGRVVDFDDVETTKIKFLKEEFNKYMWPAHDDVQIVNNNFIFYGPIALQGCGPFSINQYDTAKIKSIYKQLKIKFKTQ